MSILSAPAVQSNPNRSECRAAGPRLCAALVTETRRELARFLARAPEFRAEADAAEADIAQVEYDLTGLADLLTLAGKALFPAGVGVASVYRPLAEPADYCDALALVLARVDALRHRLEAHLKGEPECGRGDDRAWLRVAAWACWQAVSANWGDVPHGSKGWATTSLADALTAEAAACDAG